jgi:hypothetical protein
VNSGDPPWQELQALEWKRERRGQKSAGRWPSALKDTAVFTWRTAHRAQIRLNAGTRNRRITHSMPYHPRPLLTELRVAYPTLRYSQSLHDGMINCVMMLSRALNLRRARRLPQLPVMIKSSQIQWSHHHRSRCRRERMSICPKTNRFVTQ